MPPIGLGSPLAWGGSLGCWLLHRVCRCFPPPAKLPGQRGLCPRLFLQPWESCLLVLSLQPSEAIECSFLQSRPPGMAKGMA